MSDAEPAAQSSGGGSFMSVTPSIAEGRSRILLFGGLGGFAIGNAVSILPVVWGGLGVVVLAFGLNTAGKLSHYGELPIPLSDRVKLSASWVLLALTVVGLIANYAYTRYGPGGGDFFWSLAVAGIGFGLLHMAAQSKYLPEGEIGE